MLKFEVIITYLDNITIMFAFLAMVASSYNLFLRRRDMKEIEIFLIINGIKKQIPIKILRKNVTRAEIKGIMSDFDKDHNFTIKYFKTPNFINDIFLIQKGKKQTLTIKIENDDKFEFDDKDLFTKEKNESIYDTGYNLSEKSELLSWRKFKLFF